jgi:hypothetical protein
MRMLSLADTPVASDVLERWANKASLEAHQAALDRLFVIGVLDRLESDNNALATTTPSATSSALLMANEDEEEDIFSVRLSANFGDSIRASLLSSDRSTSNAMHSSEPIANSVVDDAQKHSEQCWNVLTGLLVNSGDKMPLKCVVDLLVNGGLVQNASSQESLTITNVGFQFLL